jgi:hypothetical protein
MNHACTGLVPGPHLKPCYTAGLYIMEGYMRIIVGLLLAATVFTARPAVAAQFIPTCYNLPKSQVADPTWRYSHQCREGTTIWYVYIDSFERWHLVSTNIQP